MDINWMLLGLWPMSRNSYCPRAMWPQLSRNTPPPPRGPGVARVVAQEEMARVVASKERHESLSSGVRFLGGTPPKKVFFGEGFF